MSWAQRLSWPALRFRAALYAGLFTSAAFAQSTDPGLSIQEGWSAVFGGQDAVFHATVAGVPASNGRLTWSFQVHGAVAARGEKSGTDAEIVLAVPPVKPGVILDARLTVGWQADGASDARLEKPLWIFPEDPFLDRQEWLRRLDIRLFDPERTTAGVLEDAGVPFKSVRNPETLGDAEVSIVLVGEGLSFDDYKALPAILTQAAAKGIPVLCLASSSGAFPIPGSNGVEGSSPVEVAFRRADIITRMDKRLDATAWPPDGEMVTRNLTLKADRQGVVGEVADAVDGWPWMEARYGHQRTALVLCQFPLVSRWKDGPTPRFLFQNLLEYISTTTPSPPAGGETNEEMP